MATSTHSPGDTWKQTGASRQVCAQLGASASMALSVSWFGTRQSSIVCAYAQVARERAISREHSHRPHPFTRTTCATS
eukprot:3991234-Pleurochrysis_carterae.AAC.1